MNAPLTAWGDPDVEAFVRSQLHVIVQGLSELFGARLQAVVLGGGFGRGEGSVLRRPDGSMHVVNDFDLEVILHPRPLRRAGKFLDKLIYRNRLERLARRLADQLEIKQVDFALKDGTDYAVAVPRLSDFDLKQGHQCLYGARDPVEAMPAFAAGDIPAFEAAWLLRNRGIGLLLARLYLNPDGTLREEKLENFQVEINKAALAMGDALFILNGNYHYSYAERAKRINELRTTEPGFGDAHIQKYLMASEYKLRPQTGQYPGISPARLWQETNDRYARFCLEFESRRVGKKLASAHDYARWAREQQRRRLRQLPRRLFDRMSGADAHCPAWLARLKQDRQATMAFVFAMLCARASDADLRSGGWKALDEISGGDMHAGDAAQWEDIAGRFLMLIHPGGEVGRYLAERVGSK
jgi:hypothetical protein